VTAADRESQTHHPGAISITRGEKNIEHCQCVTSDRASTLSEHFCGAVNTTGKKILLFAMRAYLAFARRFAQRTLCVHGLRVRLSAPGSLFSELS
jgi:hypothetical protein